MHSKILPHQMMGAVSMGMAHYGFTSPSNSVPSSQSGDSNTSQPGLQMPVSPQNMGGACSPHGGYPAACSPGTVGCHSPSSTSCPQQSDVGSAHSPNMPMGSTDKAAMMTSGASGCSEEYVCSQDDDTVSDGELKLTDVQVKELEASFSPTQFPDQQSLLKLAARLELAKSQVQAWFYHRQAGRSGGVGGRWQPATINDAYSPPQNTNNAESLQPDHLKHNSFSPRTSGHGNPSPSNRHPVYMNTQGSDYHSPPQPSNYSSHMPHPHSGASAGRGDVVGDDGVTSTTSWNITGQCSNSPYTVYQPHSGLPNKLEPTVAM